MLMIDYIRIIIIEACMEITGKKILMFYPLGTTVHYGQNIIKELEQRGAVVCAYDERPSQTTCMKVVIRLLKKKVPRLFLRYIDSIIHRHQEHFDYVLVIRGEAFTPQAVARLRNAYPHAVYILYLWDILKTNNIKECIPCFDRVFSFDPADARSFPNMIFRPTFYLDCFKELAQIPAGNTDILFVGTLHSDRFEILSRIRKVLDANGISCYFYYFLPSRLIFWRDMLKGKKQAHYREVNFVPLTLPETLEKMKGVKCILDLRYSTQVSLSMRAFEALASKRKYITNNPEIKKYDFYRPDNILVIDEKCPEVPLAFVMSPMKEVPEDVCRYYSIQGWVDCIFS